MTTEEIRKLQHAQPFRPFVIHTADGRKISVRHPEFMASAPAARTMVVYQPNGSFEVIDVLLIAALAVSQNGARPKRHKD